MTQRPVTVSVFAPAKINLALHVTGQRADGYHLLDTLVAFADVGDELTLRTAGDERLRVGGPQAGALPVAEDNVVLRTAVAFGNPDLKLSMVLEKHLPVSAGIGGGSADAAACYRGLMFLRGIATGQETLPDPSDMAGLLALGADVPMCVVSAPARVRGIGEVVETVAAFPRLHAVLVNPGVPVSTPAVFRALRSRDNRALDALPSPLTAAHLTTWLRGQRNDLEAPAAGVAPVIAEVLAALARSEACGLARMSGSGATCFGLYADRAAADRAAAALSAAHRGWWVRATTLDGETLVAPLRR